MFDLSWPTVYIVHMIRGGLISPKRWWHMAGFVTG